MTKKLIHHKYLPFAIATGIFLFGIVFRVKAASPSFTIDSPTNQANVSGSNPQITFTVNNFRLLDPNSYPKASIGTGHINLWLDQTTYSSDSAIKVFTSSYQFSNVRAGKHQLRAELVNNDNSPLNPPVAAEVEFSTTLVNDSNSRLSPLNLLTPLAVAIIFSSFALWMMRYQMANSKPSASPKTKPTPVKKTNSKSSKTKTKSKKSK